MYIVKTQSSFDAAHFLAGYEGKCRNIHGHRWKVEVEAGVEELDAGGMAVDFTDLKAALRQVTDQFDHVLIIEKDSLKPATRQALLEEEFAVREVAFRPTAENFARFFFEQMQQLSFPLQSVTVYETPNNCARYVKG